MESKNVSRLLHTMFSFLIMVFLDRLLLMLAGRFLPSWDAPSLLSSTVELVVFLIASGAAVFLFRRDSFPGRDPFPEGAEEEFDPVPPIVKKPVSRCVIHTVASAAALVLVMFAVAGFMTGAVPFSGTASAAGGMPGLDAVSVLSLLVIHPLVEEYLFRNAYYGELRLMNPGFACMAQAVMFALCHRTVEAMIYSLFAGVLLGFLAEHTGRFWPSAAVHILVNLRSLISVTVLAEAGSVRYAMDSILLTLGAIAFVVLTATRVRSFSSPREVSEGHSHGGKKKREAGA